MLPKYLKVHGYRSYIDAFIDFEKFGNLFCLVGENGAGKSSIIEMMTTALYYRNSCTDSKGSGMDELINNDCDHFEIQFCFEMAGSEYLIISRKFKNANRELEFYIDGIDQSEKIVETQKKISNVIKLDYDVFLDTICVGQGMSSRFMSKKPNERKETLVQILDIKKYEEYEKEAKEARKEIKAKIDELTSQIDFASSQSNDIAELENIVKEKTAENESFKIDLDAKNVELEKITKEKIEYEALVKKNALILRQRKDLAEKIANLRDKIDITNGRIKGIVIDDVDYDSEIFKIQNDIDEKKNLITSLKEEISKIKTENSFFEQEKSEIKKKHHNLESYDKSICDFCGNEITPSHKEFHLSELKEKYKKTNAKLASNNEQLSACNERGSVLSSEGKKLSQLKRELIDKQDTARRNAQVRDKLINEVKYFEESLAEYKKQYEENISITVNEVKEKEFDDFRIKQQVRDLSSAISKNEQKIAVAKSQIADSLKNEALLKKLNEKLSNLKVKLSDYESVCTAFGKKGIQKNIIKRDLPEIEKEVNKILSLLSDNTMSIEFRTSKEGSTKKDIDTLDIIVHDGITVRSYETYSGGEKFRIDFSCHIGLAKFLTKRAGATIDFFIVDEGLGSQDSSARQRFVDALHKISSIFKQVMCITHINELQDCFDTKVLVEKDLVKGSVVSII